MRATNRTLRVRGSLKLPRTLRLRGEVNQCASDTLADSRVQKPKNFLAFSSRLLPPPSMREYWGLGRNFPFAPLFVLGEFGADMYVLYCTLAKQCKFY